MILKNILLVVGLGLTFAACGADDGLDALAGKDGAAGQKGEQGEAGRDGVDASPAQIVQLCPGTTTYPNVFVEIALKINGKLLAVYSANNGFLVELVPGNYTSNAIGSSCNFTVNADLTISH